MDKPMLVLSVLVTDSFDGAKGSQTCGIEFMGGHKGQVLRFLDQCEQKEKLVLIKEYRAGTKYYQVCGE